MNYESIKHSLLVILIATTIVGCAGNSVQPPASQYQTSNSTLNGELIGSRDDTSSIDVEDVDKEEMAKQESENSLRNDYDEGSWWASLVLAAPYIVLMMLLPP